MSPPGNTSVSKIFCWTLSIHNIYMFQYIFVEELPRTRIDEDNIVLAIGMQCVDKGPPLIQWKSNLVIGEILVLVRIINVVPHGVHWNSGFLEIRHHFLVNWHIPISPSTLMETCSFHQQTVSSPILKMISTNHSKCIAKRYQRYNESTLRNETWIHPSLRLCPHLNV